MFTAPHLKGARRAHFAKPAFHRENMVPPASGITLIELLISCSILAILTLTAVPNFQHWRAKAEADNVARQINDQVRALRDLAITRGETLSLCGSNKNGQCTAGNIRYLQIFVDRNKNKQRDSDEGVISHCSLTHSGRVRLNAHGVMTMKANGRTNTPASYIYCPSTADQRALIRKVSISFTGRAYIASQEKIMAASASLCP